MTKLEAAKQLLQLLKNNPHVLEQLSKAKKIAKDDKAHPPRTPEAQAHLAAQTTTTVSDALKPLSSRGKGQMLAHLRTLSDPKQHQSPKNLAISSRQIIKKDLQKPWQPKFYKAETKHDRCARKVKERSPEVKNPHAVCVAAGVYPSKWKKSEKNKKCEKGGSISKYGYRQIIKKDLQKPWQPKFYKKACKGESMPASVGPAFTVADQNVASMKTQKDPSAKPFFATKIIKPSDVRDIGGAGMAFVKPSIKVKQPNEKKK